jgi:cellulose synthase/poly-beta-1,6-N-acetylglucosamine synthase-like glycosyltransferase
MTLLPESVQRYLVKFGVDGPWRLSGLDGRVFAGAVVIPALAEGELLFRTLETLAKNPSPLLDKFAVIVVVNNSDQAATDICLQNKIDLARLQDYAQNTLLSLAWIDAGSDGLGIPQKHAGVGFARKLGLDTALHLLDWEKDPLLICLDADTLVEEHYLKAIQSHFVQATEGAAVLPYHHQSGTTAEQQDAIDRYELFLRSYVYGLRLAGSPYAFNSVGSAMACRATAYVRCGGMNTRKAGEDYYFLQKLAKTDGMGLLSGTVVSPNPRISERVPFGTGRSMARMLDKD